MRACPNCGERDPNRVKFCLECGSPLPASAGNAHAQGLEGEWQLFAVSDGPAAPGGSA